MPTTCSDFVFAHSLFCSALRSLLWPSQQRQRRARATAPLLLRQSQRRRGLRLRQPTGAPTGSRFPSHPNSGRPSPPPPPRPSHPSLRRPSPLPRPSPPPLPRPSHPNSGRPSHRQHRLPKTRQRVGNGTPVQTMAAIRHRMRSEVRAFPPAQSLHLPPAQRMNRHPMPWLTPMRRRCL
jgi:hypothetical protein